MSAISLEQRFEFLTKLGANINWDILTPDQVQLGIREAKRTGVEATCFVQNGCRLQIKNLLRYVEDLTIEMPAMKRPTLDELRARESWIRAENGIECDTSTEDPVILRLGTVLRPDEKQIDGAEYERRMINVPSLELQHSDYLVAHQDDDTPGFAALRALKGKIYIDFRGFVVVDEGGHRRYPCVRGAGERFVQCWPWTGRVLNQNGRVAVPGPAALGGAGK